MNEQKTHSLSRRGAFRLLAAGGVAMAVPGIASGQDAGTPETAGDLQGAGFYRFKLGELNCAVISDGGMSMRPSDLFPKAGDEEVAEATNKAFVTPGFFPGQVNSLFVDTGSAKVLIDTGASTNFGPATGKLIPNLVRAGVKPTDITHVVITHAHPDHVGGLTDAQGKLQFPNAQVVISEAEHAFWTGADTAMPKSLAPVDLQKVMVDAARKSLTAVKDKLHLAKNEERIAGAIMLVAAPGHTPGHSIVRITSGDATLIHLADSIHVAPLQTAHPEWHILFDGDPETASTVRKKLLGSAAAERTLVTGCHLPFPSLGHIAKDGSAFRWVPREWQW